MDGGYDVGAVHRGLELLGIEGYTAIREYQNNALKKGFTYNQDKDCFVCENQKELNFQRLVLKRSTLYYYRLYSRARKLCKDCLRLSICEIDQGAIRINASGNYPAFHRNKLKYHTPEYVKVMRLRKIWAAVQGNTEARAAHNRFYLGGSSCNGTSCEETGSPFNLFMLIWAARVPGWCAEGVSVVARSRPDVVR